MVPAPAKLQPALFGGLFIGVLSALPIVSLGNCVCCMWVIGGGMLAVYLMQQNHPYPLTAADGALVGLLAGLVGGLISGIISIPLALMLGPFQQRFLQNMVLSRPDIPPETRTMIENMARGGVFGVLAIIRMLVWTCVACVFAMLGGLLGIALFKNKALPPGTTEVLPPVS